jgi:soluble lytic murein transglycosylase-like protein
VLLVGVLCAVLLGAVVLGAVARGLSVRGERQRVADLAALAAARALLDAQPRRLEPPAIDGRPNPRHLTAAAYAAHVRAAATATAARNGAHRVAVAFPGGGTLPTRVRVTITDPLGTPGGEVAMRVVAEAEAAATLGAAFATGRGQGEYRGPLAHRDGKPMRPDVALAYDRLHAAARADGVTVTVTSGFRTDAEQAALFARRPDPRWVAPPGRSLHRLGTELDLGPPAAYAWLARNARRFGFLQRYSWEPWHFGYVRATASRSAGFGPPRGAGALPSFVPVRYAPALRRAAQRHRVGAAVLAAQLQAESGFDPRAVSPAGARGIAQFMPATARAYGLSDPFDPDAAIDAQARLMADLLRRFGSVPLALAAYNAGPGAVQRFGGIPPYRETQEYVRRILALIGGAAAAGLPGAGGGPEVRLVL